LMLHRYFKCLDNNPGLEKLSQFVKKTSPDWSSEESPQFLRPKKVELIWVRMCSKETISSQRGRAS